MAETNFLLNTDFNNQKILLNTQQTLNVGSPAYEATYTYDHNLGYIPSARVWFEPEPGHWYPLTIRQFNDGSTGSYLDLLGDFTLTTTQILVNVRYYGVSNPKTCAILVRLYLDN